MNGHSSSSDCACTLCFPSGNKHPSLPCWGWYPGPGGCPGRCCGLAFGGTGAGIPPCLAIGGWAQRPLTLFAGGGGSCGAGGKPICCWAGGSSRGPWKAAGCPGETQELGAAPGPEREAMSGEWEMITYQTCAKVLWLCPRHFSNIQAILDPTLTALPYGIPCVCSHDRSCLSLGWFSHFISFGSICNKTLQLG